MKDEIIEKLKYEIFKYFRDNFYQVAKPEDIYFMYIDHDKPFRTDKYYFKFKNYIFEFLIDIKFKTLEYYVYKQQGGVNL